MDIELRHAERNLHVNPTLIDKYHTEVSKSFNTAWLKNIQQYLHKGMTKFRFTKHCNDRRIEKHIPLISTEKFIEEGVCFEYKLIQNTLYRFAVRLMGKLQDYVAVFQPEWKNGKLELVVVTYYANDKNDNHRTLRRWEYHK